MITIIAAITRDGALGRDGQLIYRFKGDMQHFKEVTMGHPIVMGRKTFESFPKGPLPGRRNLVVTRNTGYRHEGIETFPSLKDALAASDGDAFVIGGGEIYRAAMPQAQRLIITEIDAVAPDADTWFPGIDTTAWCVESTGEWITDASSGVNYRFVTYHRRGS